MCGLVVNPGFCSSEGIQEDERIADEARQKEGFVPIEELGIEHAMVLSPLSKSQLHACMDPLDFAVMKLDSEKYGPKTLGRNTRVV